jgi:DNA-binding response OmpR family regulator
MAKGRGSEAPKVLVVDDEVKLTVRFAEDLRASGFDARPCHDGPTALQLVEQWDPDVVLLDDRMPGMSGCDVCREIRATSWRGVILFYSGYGDPRDVVRALRAGADDHIYKGVTDAVLVAKLERAAERSREIRDLATVPSEIRELRRSSPDLLGQIEERLLHLLLAANGEVVSTQDLINQAWDRSDAGEDLLYERIHRLRKKVADHGWRIANVKGRGYRLVKGPVGNLTSA